MMEDRIGKRMGTYRATETSSQQPAWSTTCQCKPQTSVPATVLDPFAGSGTVALVAQRMNRDAILMRDQSRICRDGTEAD